jgi:hypothetical protein
MQIPSPSRPIRETISAMIGRAAVVVAAAMLLIGCSAPGSQTSASSHPATSAASMNAGAITSSTTGPSSATVAQSATAASSAPTATASAPWTLSINGLGPLKLGTPYTALRQQGYVTVETGDCPGSWTSQALQDKGVYLYPSGQGDTAVLAEVSITKGMYATVSGARVGTTMSQLRVLYGSQLTTETKNGNGGPFVVANVKVGTREIVFYFPYGSTLADTDPVQAIISRNWSADMMGEC